jgi:hypothetical protein
MGLRTKKELAHRFPVALELDHARAPQIFSDDPKVIRRSAIKVAGGAKRPARKLNHLAAIYAWEVVPPITPWCRGCPAFWHAAARHLRIGPGGAPANQISPAGQAGFLRPFPPQERHPR